MSDTSQGPGWWQASDGKWYPPEQATPAAAPTGGMPGTSPHGALADWGLRAGGILIDFAIILVLWIVAFFIVMILSIVSDTLGAIVGILLYIAVSLAWLYMGFLVGAKGQSPGMAVMGLKCVGEETGQVLGGGMGVVRTIAHVVDSIICYIGWLFPLWDAKRQTIADKLVKTVVLKDQAKSSFGLDLLKP